MQWYWTGFEKKRVKMEYTAQGNWESSKRDAELAA